MKEHKRVFASGRDVDIGRNHGVRKICQCPKGKKIPATPFKVSTETVIRLDPETPRERRLAWDEDEAELLAAANPHLRAIIVAMLDTRCPPGELLSLQWKDVDLKQRALTIRAEKTKTRRGRVLPISSRLQSSPSLRQPKCRFANARPEPVLRSRSNATAVVSEARAASAK